MCLRTLAFTTYAGGACWDFGRWDLPGQREREVTGLDGSLETFIEFLVVKATMGLLLGDG